ncbi:MAG TPA: alpha/beta fold hydrolase, partial [Candidatus Elarobacter sp.]|nr:alpha/beta fold hydrolase [Candidatus Elarobacter sp.]
MTPDAEQLDVDVGDGLHLHVTRSGFGPPLVVLHGFTGSSETWMPLRTALDDRHTIIAVDMPGHGHSSAPDDPARYALSRFSNDLARTLDMLGLERVALLGYSMGGRAALGFALAHPSRIAALVLESTLPGIADSAERAARVAADHDLADSIVRDGIAAFVDRWERLPLWASQATLPEDTRTRLRAQRLANRPDGLANSLRGAGAGANQAATDRLAE